jgi:hypothetical protein
VHGLLRVVAWALTAYGYFCLLLLAVALWKVLSEEVSGRAGASPNTSRVASWAYPVLCLGMAGASLYLARLLS